MDYYEIDQYSNGINVFFEGVNFIKVKQKSDWLGKLYVSFYKEGVLILETTAKWSWFLKYLHIDSQRLEDFISIERKRNNYILHFKDSVAYLKNHYFRNPSVSIYKNDVLVGEVRANAFTLGKPFQKFHLTFFTSDQTNLYIVLFFIMNLSNDVEGGVL